MPTDQTALNVLKFAGCTGFFAVALAMFPALAQPLGKYAGSSSYWRPNYVGTIRISQTDGEQQTYTAIADVELQAMPDPDAAFAEPGEESIRYEMRGLITVTSPVKLGSLTCTANNPTPVRISASGMRRYRGGEFGPGTAYEFWINQFIRLSNCVTSDGRVIPTTNETLQVRFDSSEGSLAQAEADMRNLVTPTAEDEAAMREQQQNVEAAMNDPEVQQAMAKLEAIAKSGKRPSDAELVAIAERLQRNPKVTQIQRPKLSPALQAQGDRPIDYSHLKRTQNPNHLKGEMTRDFGGGNGSATTSWDLRQVR